MAYQPAYKVFNNKHQKFEAENNNDSLYSPSRHPYILQHYQNQLSQYNNNGCYLNHITQSQLGRSSLQATSQSQMNQQLQMSNQQQLHQLQQHYLQHHQQQLQQQQQQYLQQQQQQYLQQQCHQQQLRQQAHLYRQNECPKKQPESDSPAFYEHERSHSYNSLEASKKNGSGQKKSGRSLASLFSPLIFRSSKSQSTTIFPFLSSSKNKQQRTTSTCNMANSDGSYGFQRSNNLHHHYQQQQQQMHNNSAATVLNTLYHPATRSTSNITTTNDRTRTKGADSSQINFLSTSQRSCPGSLKRIKSSPLTAQQATYETMRTIDMYLIRQIARNCMPKSGGRFDWSGGTSELEWPEIVQPVMRADILAQSFSLILCSPPPKHTQTNLWPSIITRRPMVVWSLDPANQPTDRITVFSDQLETKNQLYNNLIKNYELERKIELEIRMRELTAQAMMEAETELELLEVEKALLVSDHRMHCYAIELEQQRKRLSTPSLASSTMDSGRGSAVGHHRVSASGIDKRNASSDAAGQLESRASDPRRRHHRRPSADVIGADSTSANTGSSNSPGSPALAKWSPVSGESAITSQSGQSSGSASSPSGRANNDSSNTATNNNNNNNNYSNNNTGNDNKRTQDAEVVDEDIQPVEWGASSTLDRKHRSRQRSRHRRDQFRRTIGVVGAALEQQLALNHITPSTSRPARVSLSEIRIPLLWRDADHFKGRGDYKRFAAFCLVRINSEVLETQLISDVDRAMIDLTFPDSLVFPEIDHDFELCLEVYSCVYIEQFTLGSTPRKLKEKLTSSVSKAIGRRLTAQTASANYTKELEAYDKSYRFSLIASAILRPQDASNSVKTYDLMLISPTSSQTKGVSNREQHPYHIRAALPNNHSNSSSNMTRTRSHGNTLNTSLSSSVYDGSQDIYSAHRPAGATKDLQRNTLPLFGNLCCHLQVDPLTMATLTSSPFTTNEERHLHRHQLEDVNLHQRHSHHLDHYRDHHRAVNL